MASFRVLPALKPTVLLAGMLMVAPVCGLRPVRASRWRTLNVPKPIRLTSSPRAAAAEIWLANALITSLAFSRLRPVWSAIAAASSGLRIENSCYLLWLLFPDDRQPGWRLKQSIVVATLMCKPRLVTICSKNKKGHQDDE